MKRFSRLDLVIKLTAGKALLLYMIWAVAGASAQQIVRVPADQPTIQAGIDAADPGDTVLVAPGTYNENVDFKGKGITLTSGATSYSGAAATIINGTASGPVVKLITGEPASAVLNGFTIQGGFAYNNHTDIDAAVAIFGSSPTVSNNVIQNNMGCGVSVNQGASPTLVGNDIRGNFPPEAKQSQYAILCSPDGASPGTGLDIGFAGTVNVLGNTIEANSVYDSEGSSLEGTVVNGSGIYLAFTSTTILRNNIVRDNRGEGLDGLEALEGAGNGEIVLVQNLFYTDQTAGADADADVVVGGSDGSVLTTLIEVNNTISGEELAASYADGSVVENNIFFGSTKTEYSALACSYISSNLVIRHNDVVGSIPNPRLECTLDSTNLSADPQFFSPATGNFHTQRTSPVVGAGNIDAPQIPPTDLDGRNRTVCGTIDMGVYEVHPQPPLAVSSSNNPSVGGTAVTFTGSVTENCNVPTGTLTFLDGATPLGTETLSAAATASLTTSSLTVGSHNITVSYPGDFNFDPNTSAPPLIQVVTGYPTTTTLSASPNPGSAFSGITLSTTVSSGFGVPNGTVTFTTGSMVLGIVTLNANGQGTLVLATLGAGTYSIVATYNATTNYASSSATVSQTILGAESVTALTASPNPAVVGQEVTLLATVKAAQGTAVPVGTVVFSDGGNQLGSATLSPNGTASFSTAALAPGAHTLTATYSGSGNFNPSSASVTETITTIGTITSLTANPNPAGSAETVTLTATVIPAVSGVPVTGTVSFLDGGSPVGTGTLSAAGVAAFSTSSLTVGTHTLTASFPGNRDLSGSTSAALKETIIASTFNLSLTPSTLILKVGQSGTVNVQLGSNGDYMGTISLSSGPLPAYTSGTFNTSVVTLAPNGQVVATLNVTTEVLTATNVGSVKPGRTLIAGLSLFFAPWTIVLCRRRITSLLAVLFAIGIIGGLTGCGDVGYAIHTVNPGTYSIPVTATDVSGNEKASTFTLVITQ